MNVIAWLRRLWLTRLVAGLVLATFVPLASAMAPCELACALETSAEVPDHAAHMQHMHHPAKKSPAQHSLQHAGPCHLAGVPFVATGEAHAVAAAAARDWVSSSRPSPRSLVWPPPEHPPRP
jgi:hypothetical protein